jgi:SSS family solute:Na+ symporter
MCYVCTNQFYIQRCMGAKSEWDAKMGVVGCAFIKLLIPFLVVLPGLIAFTMYGPGLVRDGVYLKMVNTLLPTAGQGIMLAVLIAAIMSTVSSVLNSASTIWTVDVYKRILRPNASEQDMVRVGKWGTFTIILIGVIVAPMLLKYEKGIFVYVQELGAHFAAPISVIFLVAFCWRRAHGRAATVTLIFGIVFGYLMEFFVFCVKKEHLPWIEPERIGWIAPFMTRAGLNWAVSLVVMIVLSILISPRQKHSFDPESIWNPRWARLPEAERRLNKGWRNLMFWWLVMVCISIAIFVYFR